MKLGPVTKPDSRNKPTSKKCNFDVMSENCGLSLSFFGFLTKSEKSGGRITDTESAKVMFSVTVTFCLTKTENRTKKTITSAKLKGPRH